jgi:hypothetical protein
MLAITLEPQQGTNTYRQDQHDDWRFEIKFVNDGIIPEIRVSITSTGKKRNYSSLEDPILTGQDKLSPI